MNFDFSKFVVDDLSNLKDKMDKKELKKGVAVTKHTKEEVIEQNLEEQKTLSNMTWEDKMDYWIEKYKDTPKVIYEDLTVLCNYDEKTDIVTILNKNTLEQVDMTNGKDFFEKAVFSTKTRPEKASMVFAKYKEVTGNKIDVPFADNKVSIVDEVVEDIKENIDDMIEDTVEDNQMNIPDIE